MALYACSVLGGLVFVALLQCATLIHFDHIAMRSKEANKEMENEAIFNYLRYLLQMYFRFCIAIIIIIVAGSLDLCKTMNNNNSNDTAKDKFRQ